MLQSGATLRDLAVAAHQQQQQSQQSQQQQEQSQEHPRPAEERLSADGCSSRDGSSAAAEAASPALQPATGGSGASVAVSITADHNQGHRAADSHHPHTSSSVGEGLSCCPCEDSLPLALDLSAPQPQQPSGQPEPAAATGTAAVAAASTAPRLSWQSGVSTQPGSGSSCCDGRSVSSSLKQEPPLLVETLHPPAKRRGLLAWLGLDGGSGSLRIVPGTAAQFALLLFRSGGWVGGWVGWCER